MTGGNQDNRIHGMYLLSDPVSVKVEFPYVVLFHCVTLGRSFPSLNSSFLICKTRKSIPLDLRSSRIPTWFIKGGLMEGAEGAQWPGSGPYLYSRQDSATLLAGGIVPLSWIPLEKGF